MNQYVKPTIKLASAAANSLSAGSCLNQVDRELLESIIGSGVDLSTAFGMNEPCQNPVPIDAYCKFTSADLGAIQAFSS
ncbi:MAG: hypothetical protein ACI4IX_08300 [Acutalibacteraceae bacterium]